MLVSLVWFFFVCMLTGLLGIVFEDQTLCLISGFCLVILGMFVALAL